jgi:hypothetical protein
MVSVVKWSNGFSMVLARHIDGLWGVVQLLGCCFRRNGI